MKKFWSGIIIMGLVMFSVSSVYGAATEQAVLDFLDVVNKPLNGVVSTGAMGGEPLEGFPHFCVGTGVAAYKVDYTDPNTREKKSVYFPTVFATARIGVFGGLNIAGFGGLGSVAIGARYGVIPSDAEKTASVTGGEIRVGILNDTIATPGIAVSTTYNKVSEIKFGSDTDDAQSTMEFSNIGIKALVSKSLLIITPYVGAGFDKNSVSASYKIKSLSIDKTWDKDETVFRWLVGLEMNLLLLKVGVEYNSVGGNSAYALQARIKF